MTKYYYSVLLKGKNKYIRGEYFLNKKIDSNKDLNDIVNCAKARITDSDGLFVVSYDFLRVEGLSYKDDFIKNYPNCMTVDDRPIFCRKQIYGRDEKECDRDCVKCWEELKNV